MFKRFLNIIHSFFSNRWVNVISGIYLFICAVFSLYNLGDSFHALSFVTGIFLFISMDIFEFGFSQFLVKKSAKKQSSDPPVCSSSAAPEHRHEE